MPAGAEECADAVSRAVERIAREDQGRLLAVLVGSLRNFQLAEDSLQDAMESALVHWRRSGLPQSPAAWLLQAARRKAIDRLRRAANFDGKAGDIAFLLENAITEANERRDEPIEDDRLKLIFACCHPAIDRKTCVALTLRSVSGLKTEEIADAFVDSPTAMAQRLVRARQKIAAAGIAFEVPGPESWAERLESVLAVIYLTFNEGYAAAGDQILRTDLCEEAIRLAHLVMSLLPGEAEVEGLAALMALHHARRHGRTASDGTPLSLEEQDRRLWDHEEIVRATKLLDTAMRRGRAGPYQLQAAIAALHAEAPDFARTDWRQIALLYGVLTSMANNPVFELNRIAAISFHEGPQRALALLRPIAPALVQYQPFHALHADLLVRSGQIEAARLAYRSAIDLSQSSAEKRFLERRLARCLPSAGVGEEDLDREDGEDTGKGVVDPAQDAAIGHQPS
ncbi:RNA polymerase sigma factor [Rhizobium sp. PAMB 3174]